MDIFQRNNRLDILAFEGEEPLQPPGLPQPCQVQPDQVEPDQVPRPTWEISQSGNLARYVESDQSVEPTNSSKH